MRRVGVPRRKKSGPGQLHLVLTRGQKMALLRSADFRAKSGRIARSVYRLLEAVEFSTRGKQTRARIEILQAKMRVSRSTVIRAIREAERLGVLSVLRDDDQSNPFRRVGGTSCNSYLILWDAVRRYCSKEGRAEAEAFAGGAPLSAPTTEAGILHGGEAERWREVESNLAALGVGTARETARTAAANGLTPDECLAICAHAAALPEGYYADRGAAVSWRLRHGMEGRPSGADWPPPSKTYQVQKQREETARRNAENAAQSVAANRTAAKCVTGVSVVIPEIPAPSKEELPGLLREFFGGSPGLQFYLHGAKSGKVPAIIREEFYRRLSLKLSGGEHVERRTRAGAEGDISAANPELVERVPLASLDQGGSDRGCRESSEAAAECVSDLRNGFGGNNQPVSCGIDSGLSRGAVG